MRRATTALLLGGWVSVLATGLTGCKTIDGLSDEINDLKAPVTAEWAATGTKVSRDEYKQSLRLRGPDVDERIDWKGSYYRVHLRGTAARNGADRFQIYVATHFEEQWRNLKEAKDQDGIPLAVHKVSRKEACGEKGCAFYEHILMPVTRQYLETRSRDAIRLDIEGPGGEVHVVVPGEYVKGFLERLDRVQGKAKKQAKRKTAGVRISFCEAKYEEDREALRFCHKQARASYERLEPARRRARRDAFTDEAKRLDACMRRNNGRFGIDWMMVEHCFGKGGGPVPAAR